MKVNDYKYDIQALAEEMAVEQFGKEFAYLDEDQMVDLYREATTEYWERKQMAAEAMEDTI